MIGAFAITNSVLLIVAGLGAGAIWVRSLTVYLLRTGALSKYKYLENGAHWGNYGARRDDDCQIIPLGITGMGDGWLGLIVCEFGGW